MAVWKHYFPLVRSLACRGFGPYRGFSSPSDVEDAVSATFAAAFEQGCRMRYDGVIPYGSFLLGIGRNVMRRQMKKAAREPVADLDCRTEADEGAPSPEEQLLSLEEKEVLGRFRTTLEAHEREVYEGHFRDGLSEERLAHHLGRTRHTVRKTLHRVMRRFRRYLRENGLDTE
ncbi:MAG: sigma-70 family RNA polymerase sigma factor [Deltaproteobacteria bacterium]|nr:sigma-70 family RNA polymerase sigma factor [Deltaproteobacteria bacterium]